MKECYVLARDKILKVLFVVVIILVSLQLFIKTASAVEVATTQDGWNISFMNSTGYNISQDGRFVVFGGGWVDRLHNTTTYSSNIAGNPQISDDGRYIISTSMILHENMGVTHYPVMYDRITGAVTKIANKGSEPRISHDTNFISFHTNDILDSGDKNYFDDIYLYNRTTGTFELISLSSDGTSANGNCWGASLSGDGRYIVFQSNASNLVPGDTNGVDDIFVRDRVNRTTTRVSVSSTGIQSDGYSYEPTISDDGRYVVFVSNAKNIVPNDTNIYSDIFIYDTKTGHTRRVDDSSPMYNSTYISGNGRFIVFQSNSSNLVEGDSNERPDIFTYNLATGEIRLISVKETTGPWEDTASSPSINYDGKYIAFSTSTKLTAMDTDSNSDIYLVTQEVGTEEPKTEISVSGTLGTNGWYKSDVQITLTALDKSGIGLDRTEYSLNGIDWVTYTAPLTISTNGTTTLHYRSIDNAENIESSKTAGIQIDKTPPIITGEAITAPNDNDWYNTDVTVWFTASDADSGIDPITPDTAITTEGVNQSATRTVTDKAGNVATYTVTGINIDKTPPEVSINIPMEGAEYTLGQTILAHWSASDGLSGIDTATGTVPSREAIDTSTVGLKTFTVIVEDKAGNRTEKTVSYRVVYTGEINLKSSDGKTHKLGSTIPVKFTLKDANGSLVTNASAELYAAKIVDGKAGEEQKASSTSSAASDNLFRYDNTDGQYIFNLSTKELSAGTWQLRIALDDGSSKTIFVTLR